MKVKFTKDVKFALNGISVKSFKKGEEVELSDSDAATAIKGNFAEAVKEAKAEKPAPAENKKGKGPKENK